MAAFADFLGKERLSFLHFTQAVFIGSDHRGIICVDQLIQKLGRFSIHLRELPLHGLFFIFSRLQFFLPDIAEHLKRHGKQVCAGFEISQKNCKLAFDLFLANGLAVLNTAFGVAQVIRILRTTPF